MVGRVTCKNVEDPSKNKRARQVGNFSFYESMGILPRETNSADPDQIVTNFKPNHPRFYSCCCAIMNTIQSKMKALECSQSLPNDVSDHQGQPTTQLVMGSGRNIASSKIVSEYDQDIPQSQTADNTVAPRGRAAQPSRDTRKTK